MNLQRDLPLRLTGNAGVRMVVESPRGSAIKYAYDVHTETFTWSRPLVAGLTFPYDFGFLPQTLAEDGDALDAMLLTELASPPGVVVGCRVLGALRVQQFRGEEPAKRNDRIMLIPLNEHRSGHLKDVTELPPRVRDELEEFFAASLRLTGKTVKFGGWASASEADAIIDAAATAFH